MLRDGNKTDDDIEQTKALKDTDTSNWPEHYVKLYISNLAGTTENEQSLASLNSEIYTINAKDSKRIETQEFWKYQPLMLMYH